jgi:hypothetical protein
VYVPEVRAVCSGDIAYNNIHMWLWRSTPDSRQAWRPWTRWPPSSQSRRYIEDFGQAVARSSTPREAVAVMLEKYPAYGKPVHPVRRGIQPVPSLNREFRL